MELSVEILIVDALIYLGWNKPFRENRAIGRNSSIGVQRDLSWNSLPIPLAGEMPRLMSVAKVGRKLAAGKERDVNGSHACNMGAPR